MDETPSEERQEAQGGAIPIRPAGDGPGAKETVSERYAAHIDRGLLQLGQEQEQIRAELHALGGQMIGVILLVALVGGMVWALSRRLEGAKA
jgi:hypothetical protein